jgi:DNA-binding CsgD family transcriptional regulator
MPSDEVLHSLIQLIYEAAIDADKWPAFLRQWSLAVGAQGTAVVVHDLNGRNGSIDANVGFDPESLRIYQNHYAALNPWVARSQHLFLPGNVVNCDDLISPQELTQTEFYAGWLRPNDFFHSYGGAITCKDGIVSYVTAMRSRRAGAFEEQELTLLRILIPHLECAARLHLRVAGLQGQLAVTAEALDRMDRGVLITDSEGKILVGNALASKILSHCDGLKCSGGHLTCPASSESHRMKLMLAAAAAITAGHSKHAGTSMTVSRPSGRRSLELFISPLRKRSAGWMKVSGVLVVITDPDDAGELSHEALKELFGLTPAEVRLASALGAGMSLARAAESFGVAVETVRTQLKSIFLKTGTKRQSELARLLATSARSPR